MTELDRDAVNRIRAHRTRLPNHSQTAIVMDRGAPLGIIRVFACSEGYQELADALFDIECGVQHEEDGQARQCGTSLLLDNATLTTASVDPLEPRQPPIAKAHR